MDRLPRLARQDLDDSGQRLWDSILDTRGASVLDGSGGLAGPFNAWLHAPEVGHRLASLGATLRFGTSIERRLTELAIITVGARWRAEFEWWAHVPMARDHGIDTGVIEAIGAGRAPDFSRDDERIVYGVARGLAETGRLEEDSYQAARQLLGDGGLVELVSLCGYYGLISYLLNAFDVRLPPGASSRWAD